MIRHYENEILYNQLEDLVDIAIYECEKYYPAFQLILFDDSLSQEALDLCAIETIGLTIFPNPEF